MGYSNGEVELYNPKNLTYLRSIKGIFPNESGNKFIMDSTTDNNGVEKINIYTSDRSKTLQKYEVQNYNGNPEYKNPIF